MVGFFNSRGKWNSYLGNSTGTFKLDVKNKDLLLKYFKVFSEDILGLDLNDNKNNQSEIVDLLLEIREKERENKNFETSDYIRNKLNSLGINIEDS